MRDTHTHTHTHKHPPLHMFEQNYKSSVTQNSFQFILFIIEMFSPLQLAITLYSMRGGDKELSSLRSLSMDEISHDLVRGLTFDNSSFMSLATTFSLCSIQCIPHGSYTVCTHRDTFWPEYIMFTEKIVDHFENLFLPPGSCLQNRNSSCISFWSTNHKKAKS